MQTQVDVGTLSCCLKCWSQDVHLQQGIADHMLNAFVKRIRGPLMHSKLHVDLTSFVATAVAGNYSVFGHWLLVQASLLSNALLSVAY